MQRHEGQNSTYERSSEDLHAYILSIEDFVRLKVGVWSSGSCEPRQLGIAAISVFPYFRRLFQGPF